MSFFSFKSNPDSNDDSSANWNCLPKVDILKIDQLDIGSRESRRILCRCCQPPTEASLILEVFPNIRILKFKCSDVRDLSSALWALCPNVEFMEIYGIACYSIGGSDFGNSHYVDKFFTGFSDRMLENLRRSGSGLPCAADDLEELKSAPKTPSISDLTRLKELKFKFVRKWSSEFASSVTGLHAFSKMENTKFIISYDPEACVSSLKIGWNVINCRNNIVGNIGEGNESEKNDDHKIAKYEELIFGPIKTYVHIVHEKQKWD